MSINVPRLFLVVFIFASSFQLNAQLSKKALKSLYKNEFTALFNGDKTTFKEMSAERVRIVDGYYTQEDGGDAYEYFLEEKLNEQAFAVMRKATQSEIFEIPGKKPTNAVAYISEPFTVEAYNRFGKKKVVISVILEQNGNDWQLVEFAQYAMVGDVNYRENILKSLEKLYGNYALKDEVEKFVELMKAKEINKIFDYRNSAFMMGGETWRMTSIMLMEQFDQRSFYNIDGLKIPKKYNDMTNKDCMLGLMDYLKDDLVNKRYRISVSGERYNGYADGNDEYSDHWNDASSILDLTVEHLYTSEDGVMEQHLLIGFNKDEKGIFLTYVRHRNEFMNDDKFEEEMLEELVRELEIMEEAEAETEEEGTTEQYFEETEEVELVDSQELLQEIEEAIEEALENTEPGEDYEMMAEEWTEEDYYDHPEAYITALTVEDQKYGLLLSELTVELRKVDDQWKITGFSTEKRWADLGDTYMEGTDDYYGSSSEKETIWEECISTLLDKNKPLMEELMEYPVNVLDSDSRKEEHTTREYLNSADEVINWLNNTMTKEFQEIFSDPDHQWLIVDIYSYESAH